jgi:hypothetical protein
MTVRGKSRVVRPCWERERESGAKERGRVE